MAERMNVSICNVTLLNYRLLGVHKFLYMLILLFSFLDLMMNEGYLELKSLIESKKYEELDFKKFFTLFQMIDNDSDFANEIIEDILNDKFLEKSHIILAQKLHNDKTLTTITSAQIESLHFICSRLKSRILIHFPSENRYRRILENVIEEITEQFRFKNPTITSGFTKNYSKFDIIDIFQDYNDKKCKNIEKNIVTGPYHSYDQYINIQRDLIIEDFTRPLKQTLKDYLKTKKIIPNAQILHSYGAGVLLSTLEPNSSSHADEKIKLKLKHLPPKIDWNTTSRLIFGSLVILESDSILTFWTVFERTITPNFDQELHLVISPLSPNQNWPPSITTNNAIINVFESVIYFEAYRPVIQALYSLRQVPFQDQLVYLKNDLKFRSWQDLKIRKLLKVSGNNNRKTTLDPSEVLKNLSLQGDNEKNQNYYQVQDLNIHELKVNASQLDALKIGLENKIALIQGPPGTGKSYIGILLAQILCSNLPKNSPLVVVCYTNHALDTFLEGCLTNFTSKIVRIGGRSKSNILEPFNLSVLRKNLLESGSRDKKIYTSIKSLEQKLHQTTDKNEYDKISRSIKHWNNLENLQIISKAEIIGMTTTGAAKNHNLLRMLDPKIMIIEEAGQVLEAHILASLTPNLQQLGMLFEKLK